MLKNMNTTITYTANDFKILCMSPLSERWNDDDVADCQNTGWNDKIVVLKKTTLQLYFKTFIEKINSANLIM